MLASINTALVHVSRSAAEHLGPDGIRVVAVHPGPTATERLLRMFGGDRERAQSYAAGQVPIGRLVEPAEVAATITWLCSGAAAAITGESILVDGGAAAGTSEAGHPSRTIRTSVQFAGAELTSKSADRVRREGRVDPARRTGGNT